MWGVKLGAVFYGFGACFMALLAVFLLCGCYRAMFGMSKYTGFLGPGLFIQFIYACFVTMSESGAVCGGYYLKGTPSKEDAAKYALNAYGVLHTLAKIQLSIIAGIFGLFCFCVILSVII